jgi:hypothetical protein
MKTIVHTTAIRVLVTAVLVFGIHIQLLQAKSPEKSIPMIMISNITYYAPVTPKLADFDEPVPARPAAIQNPAPETPKEASFTDEDASPAETPSFLKEVAPVTPNEADFNDSDPTDQSIQGEVVARPEVPAEASFDEN